jgi:Spy/CpxP family protein refolding chaperone
MKKSGKLSLLLVLALTLSLGLAGSVWAQPTGKGMGHGPGMMNLTPDQAGKIFDLKEKMHADTAGLRKQMMVKHAELAALWKAEKPDQTAILAKQKELNALRDQMQEKMTAFKIEAKKIAPDCPMGMGMGMGMSMGHGCCMDEGGMGMGRGMGHGPGMGMGPGAGKGMGPGAGPTAPPPPPPAK